MWSQCYHGIQYYTVCKNSSKKWQPCKIGMVNESKRQHIGKPPSLYLFHTTGRQHAWEHPCSHLCGIKSISELWPFTPQFQTSVNELVPCGQEGQRVTWRFSEKGYKDWGEQSSFPDVEHINGTSCSDFMKVAFPLLKVYKVGKNSSMNIIFKDKESW